MSYDALEPIQVGDYTVQVVYDQLAENPRDEFDTLGTIEVFGRFQPALGSNDCDHSANSRREKELDEALREILDDDPTAVVLPLNVKYDGVIDVAVPSTRDKFTAAIAGYLLTGDEETLVQQLPERVDAFIYANTRQLIHEYEDDSPETRTIALDVMKGEIATYNQWVNGDVYGFIVTNADDDEIDSCWGFYDIEECQHEGESSAECAAKSAGRPVDSLAVVR